MPGNVGHTAPKPPTKPSDTTASAGGQAAMGGGSTAAGVGTGIADAAATDASMTAMMAAMHHNTIIGNLASVAESNNNLLVNLTGGLTKVTSNVGRNVKDSAG